MPTVYTVTESDIRNDYTNKTFLVGGHVELTVTFLKNEAPVFVKRPTAIFKRDGVPFTPDKILKHLHPTGHKEGEYKISFLTTDKWSQGYYDIILEGYYPDVPSTENEYTEENKLTIKSEFEVQEVAREQGLIDVLRSQLADDFPELYKIDPDDRYKLSDGQLYQCLLQSVDMFNDLPPSGAGSKSLSFSLENIPFSNYLIVGAEIKALNKLGLLEAYNTINYQANIVFQQNRFPMLFQKFNVLLNWYTQNAKETKKDYATRLSRGVKVLISTKLPLRVIRALSMNKNFDAVFGFGSTYGFGGY